MNGAKVGVLKESNKVSLRCFLKSQDGRSLESKISLELLGDLTDKALERELSDEELRRLLVSADLTKSDGTGSVSVRLLDTSSGGGRFSCSLLKRSYVSAMVGVLLVGKTEKNVTLVASCLRGALPPVDLRAVCLVRAIL